MLGLSSLARTLLVAAVLTGGLSRVAQAQSRCLVLDPELAGTYQGACVDGKAEGQGTAKGESATYTGGFHEGRKQGRGIKTWAWGDRYEGEFAEDYKQGWGVYTWGAGTLYAGDRYEGGFARDKRNGYGVYLWASGDSYAGPWKDDALTGRASPMMIARYRATNAALEATKPGTRLCHETAQGGVADARTEAETRSADAALRQISIRITKLGVAPVVVAGRQLAVGDVVQDDPLHWIPCN